MIRWRAFAGDGLGVGLAVKVVFGNGDGDGEAGSEMEVLEGVSVVIISVDMAMLVLTYCILYRFNSYKVKVVDVVGIASDAPRMLCRGCSQIDQSEDWSTIP